MNNIVRKNERDLSAKSWQNNAIRQSMQIALIYRFISIAEKMARQ